ncbi:MAG: hypothetical protein JWQ27_2524 [Ferruginibacter sp.]|nr:hypothetical protein [Ferruginibacter sp.]
MKPKLIFFINTLNFGGAERVVSQLLQHLNEDYELHLALYGNLIKYPIPANVKICDLGESIQSAGLTTLLRLPIVARKLAAYCKKEQILTCVAFLNRPCYVSAMMRAFWGFKGKLVMCERSYQSSILNFLGGGSVLYKKITERLIHWSYQRADLVLTNSEISKLDLKENFGISTPIRVIYNPIDLQSIAEKINEQHNIIPDGRFNFISTGIFRVEKNFPVLLRAVALLKHLPIRLYLIGGGALEKELKQLATDLGISDYVVFPGFLQNPFTYMAHGDCFVLSSHTEGFPNVLLEALACGRAVVSTDCKSGPRELLAPGTPITKAASQIEEAEYGLLVPVDNAELLARAMEEMYNNRELRERYEGKSKQYADKFDVEYIKHLFINAFSV